jgi:hypothetical protein
MSKSEISLRILIHFKNSIFYYYYRKWYFSVRAEHKNIEFHVRGEAE